VATITSYKFELVNDTDGAGGSEISLGDKTVLLAALTEGSLHKICRVSPGLCTQRYLTLKVTQTGNNSTTGKIKAWLQKSADGVPSNAAIA
jgi:hypothetical protein